MCGAWLVLQTTAQWVKLRGANAGQETMGGAGSTVLQDDFALPQAQMVCNSAMSAGPRTHRVVELLRGRVLRGLMKPSRAGP